MWKVVSICLVLVSIPSIGLTSDADWLHCTCRKLYEQRNYFMPQYGRAWATKFENERSVRDATVKKWIDECFSSHRPTVTAPITFNLMELVRNLEYAGEVYVDVVYNKNSDGTIGSRGGSGSHACRQKRYVLECAKKMRPECPDLGDYLESLAASLDQYCRE